MGIEQCAGCSSLGTEPAPAPAQPTGASIATVLGELPLWALVAIGGGVGVGAYLLLGKSRILANPRKTTAQLTHEAAALAVQAGIPTMLWGDPGIGKTSWLEALGRTMGAKVFTVIGSTKDPADIGGLMRIDGTLTPPSWAREIQERSMAGQRSVLFLDEFSSMTPMVHSALLRVVREKIAGECDMDPANGPLKGRAVHVVCAANPRGHGASAIDLPPPAANRMIHLEWPTPNALTYGLGLILGWPKANLPELPDDWQKSEVAKSSRKMIGDFVKIRRSLLFKLPDGKSERGRAWPSPRSWEIAADALGAAQVAGASFDVSMILIKGAVGAGPGEEFNSWMKNQDLPDPEAVLADPTIWTPDESRRWMIHIVANGVCAAYQAKPTPERWDACWAFFGHIVDTAGESETYVLIPAFRQIMAGMQGKMKLSKDEAGFTKGQYDIPRRLLELMIKKTFVTGHAKRAKDSKRK